MGFRPIRSGEVITIGYNLKVFNHKQDTSYRLCSPSRRQGNKPSTLTDPSMNGIMPLRDKAGLNTKFNQSVRPFLLFKMVFRTECYSEPKDLATPNHL